MRVRWTGALESLGLLTALPVPARATASARGVLPWAPLVGLLLGGIAAGVAVLGAALVSPAAGAVLALVALAALTRALHLDGLADTADGLGPLRDRERALAVMRRGDVGPFGVAAVVLVLLLQAACIADLLTVDGGWQAVWAAVVAGRLVLVRTGLPRTPVAEGSRLGSAVAGTVRPPVLAAWTLLLAILVGGAAAPDWAFASAVAGSAVAGLAAGEWVLRSARRRLGGVNGDVMGAMAETTAAVTLLGAAAALG